MQQLSTEFQAHGSQYITKVLTNLSLLTKKSEVASYSERNPPYSLHGSATYTSHNNISYLSWSSFL